MAFGYQFVLIKVESWMRVSTICDCGYLNSRSIVDNSKHIYIQRSIVDNCGYLSVRSFGSKMVGTNEAVSVTHNAYSNDSIQNVNGNLEEKLDELRHLMGKVDGDPLRIVGVGAGAWGSVFTAMLQEAYGGLREKVLIRIWRRPGRTVDRATAKHLFEVINSREDVLRRLIRRCAYLKYVEGRLGDRVLYADEILKDGFCLNMVDTPLCPFKVVTNLQEAVWDADIVINGLPSTETREVFEEISKYWKERITVPVIISLAKGVEAELGSEPRIITPTLMISRASK